MSGGKHWQMEVFKMALYMAFPVGCFYFFNRPEVFNKIGYTKDHIASMAHLDTSDNQEDKLALKKLRYEKALEREKKWKEQFSPKSST